jgi:hypothetical protein
MALVLASLSSLAQTTNILVNPEADAFIRAAAPAANYGGAGSLSVGGVTATNGFGVLGGRADSLVRFNLGESVNALDSAFGNHDWFVVSAVLQLYEIGTPNNALFSRGIGAFEVRWLASGDNWVEGSGSPNVSTTDGVAFQDLPSLLNPAQDLSLGVFTNKSTDGPLAIQLRLPPGFVEDLRAGGLMTLQFTPASNSIGFTLLSRSDPRTNLRITLNLTVAAGSPPRISAIESASDKEVAIHFTARSNWTYVVQYCGSLPTNADNAWLNLFTVSAQSSNTQAVVRDAITNAQGFYRLVVVP